MKKIIIIIIGIISIIGIKDVKAKEFHEGFYTNVFVAKEKGNLVTFSNIRVIHEFGSENKVFSLDINQNIIIEKDYDELDINDSKIYNVTKLNSSQLERIRVLANVGYNKYKTTNNIVYYAVTQLLIWQITNSDMNLYLVHDLNGIKTNEYDQYALEILNLANEFYNNPSYRNIETNINLYEELTITDLNNQMQYYKLSNQNNNSTECTQDGNKIIFKNKDIDSTKFTFTRTLDGNDSKIYNLNNVNYLSPGKISKDNTINLNVNYSQMIITFNADDVLTSSFEATYGIFDVNDRLIEKIIANNVGVYHSKYLPNGQYYFRNITIPTYYVLNNKKYEFNLNNNIKDLTINFQRKQFMLGINKYYNDELEENACYNVRNVRNGYEDTICTEKGKIYKYYEKGTYMIKQVSSTNNGYVADYELELYNDSTVIIYSYDKDNTKIIIDDNIENKQESVLVYEEPLNEVVTNEEVQEINNLPIDEIPVIEENNIEENVLSSEEEIEIMLPDTKAKYNFYFFIALLYYVKKYFKILY